MMRFDQGLFARMMAKTKIEDRGHALGPCWVWQGAKVRGHGKIKIAGQLRYVHRAAWEVCKGEIPHALVLDHCCRTRDCWRPSHVEPVTAIENTKRGAAARRAAL